MVILRHMESMNMKLMNTKKDMTMITKATTMNMKATTMITNMKKPEEDMPVKFLSRKHWRKPSGCKHIKWSRALLPM